MSAILHASLRIPAEVREGLVEVVERTRNQFRFSEPDLSFMFMVYNAYLAPPEEPERMECSGCRTRVVGWLRAAVQQWRENGIVNGNDPEQRGSTPG